VYLHVGPYTPYFGFGYKGIGNVLTMWPLMFDPLTNPTTSSKPVSRIAQADIVTNHGKPSNDDEDHSKRKHNPKMSQIILILKSCHD
jgi:hypothetical protein